MTPAHPRLGSVELVVGEVQRGLVEHLQLAFVDGLAQLVLQLQTLQGAGLQVVGEKLEGVATQVLGMLHGHVGLADQCADLAGVVRQQADPQRGADHQFVPADGHRHAQLGQQPTGNPRQAGEAAIGIEDDGKFISRQPRDAVGLGYGLGQAAAYLA